MRRRRRFLAHAIAPFCGFMAAGCDVLPNVQLYNGTGRSLALAVARGSEEPRRLRLDPGGSMRVWNLYDGDLRLSFDGCERRYALPRMDLNYPWRIPDGHGGSAPDYEHRYPVAIQLQADTTLNLMPKGGRRIVPARELASAQAHGYPLQPVGSNCR